MVGGICGLEKAFDDFGVERLASMKRHNKSCLALYVDSVAALASDQTKAGFLQHGLLLPGVSAVAV